MLFGVLAFSFINILHSFLQFLIFIFIYLKNSELLINMADVLDLENNEDFEMDDDGDSEYK